MMHLKWRLTRGMFLSVLASIAIRLARRNGFIICSASILANLAHMTTQCASSAVSPPCLGVCYNGPLLVVYPEGIWYHSVDESLLRRIVDEHLRQNRPVEEFVFHRLLPAPHAMDEALNSP